VGCSDKFCCCRCFKIFRQQQGFPPKRRITTVEGKGEDGMSLLDSINTLLEILYNVGNIKLYEKLKNIQKDALELVEENEKLKEENRELKEKLQVQGSLIFEGNLYWLIKQDNKKEGPFCSKCWDENEKLIRLHSDGVDYNCPVCKTHIDTDLNDTNIKPPGFYG
jgi:regulator of replication initiation timing